jgi:hypothetical protein
MPHTKPQLELVGNRRPASAPKARTLAFTSGKGGVGKTCVSANLGVALAQQGQRVCIFDADTGLANVNILLNLRPQYTLEHLLKGEKTIAEILHHGPDNLEIVPAASGIAECADLDADRQRRLLDALSALEASFDYLLIDTAAGAGSQVLSFLQSAEAIFLVITHEPTSLTDAFSLLRLYPVSGAARPREESPALPAAEAAPSAPSLPDERADSAPPEAPPNAPEAAATDPQSEAECEHAVQRFRDALRLRSEGLGAAIENLAFRWIDRGYLNMAHAMLRSARSRSFPIPGGLLEPDLLKAAHYGMNVWSRDSEAFAVARELLNPLTQSRIDAWHGRDPGGGPVSCLLFAAAFQPAVFGGDATPAPTLLEYIAQDFGEAHGRMIREFAALSLRQKQAPSLAALRSPPEGDGNPARHALAVRLGEWRDRIAHKQTGWAPMRKALLDCLGREEFARAIQAIESPDSDDAAGIAALIDRYRDRQAIGALLDELAANQPALAAAHPIEYRNAKSWFALNIVDLCGIAGGWLAEHRSRREQAERAKSLGGRLLDRLDALREAFEATARSRRAFEPQAAARLAALCVANLRRAIADEHSGLVLDLPDIEASLSLPYDMMAAVGFAGDEESQLAWLAERLV